MASPAGETVALKIIESSGEEEEKKSAPIPSRYCAVRCRTKTCPVRGMLTSQRDAVTLTVSLETSGIEISQQFFGINDKL